MIVHWSFVYWQASIWFQTRTHLSDKKNLWQKNYSYNQLTPVLWTPGLRRIPALIGRLEAGGRPWRPAVRWTAKTQELNLNPEYPRTFKIKYNRNTHLTPVWCSNTNGRRSRHVFIKKRYIYITVQKVFWVNNWRVAFAGVSDEPESRFVLRWYGDKRIGRDSVREIDFYKEDSNVHLVNTNSKPQRTALYFNSSTPLRHQSSGNNFKTWISTRWCLYNICQSQ